jgi:hypothetical protein
MGMLSVLRSLRHQPIVIRFFSFPSTWFLCSQSLSDFLENEERGLANNAVDREEHEFISFTHPIAICPLTKRFTLFRLQGCFIYDFNRL